MQVQQPTTDEKQKTSVKHYEHIQHIMHQQKHIHINSVHETADHKPDKKTDHKLWTGNVASFSDFLELLFYFPGVTVLLNSLLSFQAYKQTFKYMCFDIIFSNYML